MDIEPTPASEPERNTITDSTTTVSQKQKSGSTLPLMITFIGIFCYLGVVLPSVFNSPAHSLGYSIFDMLLMVGGAVLVGLGAFFWFKAKTKALRMNEKKTPELA